MLLAVLRLKTLTAMIGIQGATFQRSSQNTDPCFSEEEVMEMDDVPGAGK